MKYLKLTLVIIIFLVSVPLSWLAAWHATNSFLAVGLSVVLPIWGTVFWGLSNVFGDFYGIGAISVILGLAGAWLSQMVFLALVK